jgi:ribosomal-protein-alanine N-acetyltransferase
VPGRGPELRSERLVLRRWRTSDREPFAALNADPEVMEHFLRTSTRGESDAFVDRIEKHFAEHGFGPWAVEIASTGSFAGFVGLQVPRFQAHFTPAVEVGWRLAREHWGRGYATEAARAALALGFDERGLEEIVSFTVPGNVRSRKVMERLGMTHDPSDDFEHPGIPEGHRLRLHVLYRLRRGSFQPARDPTAEPPSPS